MKIKEIKEMADKYLVPTYGRIEVAFSKGRGAKLYDTGGREYLDFLSGLAVNGLGHSHPKIVKAIEDQAENIIHTSNLYYIKPQAELAKELSKLSFGGKAFFCNSGAEANEAAIKLARKFGKTKGGKYEIITMIGSFHGRTLAALTATGQMKYQCGYEPLMPGFRYTLFNDIEAVFEAITPSICAIMLELIQGEGGVNVACKNFVKEIRKLCDDQEMLLIFDEVQTGIGRTGKMFCCQHYGVRPDIMILAKALGNGVPIGAILAKEEIAPLLGPGSHASTFGGNFLACRAALATLETIKEENLLENASKMGDYLFKGLSKLKQDHSFVCEVRGKGLMIGMELNIEGAPLVSKCLDKGLLINCVTEKTLRFLPPLIITKEEIDKALGILEDVFKEVESG